MAAVGEGSGGCGRENGTFGVFYISLSINKMYCRELRIALRRGTRHSAALRCIAQHGAAQRGTTRHAAAKRGTERHAPTGRDTRALCSESTDDSGGKTM